MWVTFMSTAVLVIAATLIITTAIPTNNDDADQILEGKHGPVCATPGCIHTASTILDNLDQTVNPCDDFYEFACGNFIKQTVIPDDKSRVNYFNIINDKILQQLRTVIEEPTTPNEPRPFLLLKKYYNLCINKAAIEDDGLKTIKGILNKLGGWPVVEGSQWQEENFEWTNTMYEFRKIGLPVDNLINMYAGEDVRNSSRRIVQLDQATLGLEREYLVEGFDNKVVRAYYDYLVDAAVIFGANREYAGKEIRDVVEFEIKLAKINLPREERRNLTELSNQIPVTELIEKYPAIPWRDYLNNIVGVSDVCICPNDIVDVNAPKFITKLEKLLERTPKRIQANYLINQVVASSVTYLTKELRDRELKYTEVYQGTQAMAPRWRECLELVSASDKLDIAAGALYARKYFNEDAKKNAAELVSNLRSTFVDMLKKVDWMDEATKSKALEKADAMGSHVAYPQELLDDTKLEEFYEKLEPNTDNFLEMNLAIKRFKDDLSYMKLLKIVNKTDWTEHSSITTVNAYYNLVENSIQLPAGILQGVFFNNDRPHYMNYGAMGFAIGHEITHGFDDVGRQFDKNGELSEWWAEKTKQAFVNKAECIIDQYGNFTAEEVKMNLNGISTQGENIADNGGVKEAYLAYNMWAKQNGEEPRLPGLKYTPRQLFWISTATLWCAKQRTEFLMQQILTDDHSPPNFRVLVPLGNSEAFSKDFNCPIGSKMNPKHKCHVW